MARGAGIAGALTRLSVALAPRLVMLPIIALSLIATAVVLPDPDLSVLLGAGGATVMIVFAVLGTLLHLHGLREAAATDAVADFVRDDAAPSFITAADGGILHSNRAAVQAFPKSATGLTALFDGMFASPASVMRRLRTRASGEGSAAEDVVTQRGHARLSVHRLPRDRLLWRFEEFSVPPRGANGFDLALITVGRSDSILSMNPAARRLVGGRPRSLPALFDSLPLRSGETHRLITAAGPTAVRVVELGETGGRRELVLLPEPDGQIERLGGLEDLLCSLPVPILLMDEAGTVELANMPARDMLGPDCRDGAPLSALLEGLGRSLTDWLAEAVSGRGPVHSEFLRLSADDAETFVQVTLKPIDRGGRRGVIATLSDATELKALEAQFVQSQKMQAIGQLAGGVAHDFNNLLTAISGHCDLLLLRHDPGDPDYSDLIQISQNANRAASLVGQLLAFSRKQTLRPQVLDLRDTLSDLTHLLNRLVGEKVRLTLSHDPVLRTIRGDKRQLEQVIMNLVVNARDAMPDGGDIRIVTESLRLPEPMKRDRAEVAAGEYVSVKVVDTGRGITPDKLAKVFEPFFTTKRVGEGTGLGLSTAYGIVKQSGGFIFADSDPERGSCFTLLLPVYEAPAVPARSAQNAACATARKPGRFAEGVVLLVEDEAPVRAFASQALRLRGYTVLEADSAEAALETLNDRDLKVDIFVTDVVMPGLDGPSWVRKALESRPEVRVVFVSGYAEENFGDAQAHIPNSVFLPKPFSLTQLTETVHRQLH